MLLAFTCIGVFLMFATKRVGTVIAIYIAFNFLPRLFFLLILTLFNNFPQGFVFLDLIYNLEKVRYLDQMVSGEIAFAVMAGLFYILAATAGGVLLFKRSEIK